MRVVVIGGGIVGLSSAHALATRGVDVVLCEKGSLGTGSTARALGGIRSQFSTPVNVDLSLASLPVWESFEERFGVDIEFRQAGYLFLARTEGTARLLEEQVGMQRERGAETELLSPTEAVEVCRGVRQDAVTAATYNPQDGYADPYLAAQGYASAVRDAGIDVRTKTAVTDVHVDEGRVVGVAVDGPDGPDGVEANAVERASVYCDYFGPETRLKRGWAGLYAVTPDHHPIIEESRPGFVQAIGFSGHGFQHAPATGQLVAELLVDGESSTVDISPLSSDRFDDGELLHERNVA